MTSYVLTNHDRTFFFAYTYRRSDLDWAKPGMIVTALIGPYKFEGRHKYYRVKGREGWKMFRRLREAVAFATEQV